MNTTEIFSFKSLGKKAAMMGFALATLSVQAARADIPDRPRSSASMPALAGMYKVVASTDPMFPSTGSKEWFLDFGEKTGKNSGTVAVSLRENPSVRVRIMVWQSFPESANFVLGNQTQEGSKQAVAMAKTPRPSKLLLKLVRLLVLLVDLSPSLIVPAILRASACSGVH